MRRPLTLLAALTLTSALAAPAPDCRPGGLFLASSDGIIYPSLAKFPEPSRSVSINFLRDYDGPASGPLTLCGFRFTPVKAQGTLKITSARFTDFSRIYRDGYDDTGLIVVGNLFTYADSGLANRTSQFVFNPKSGELYYENPRADWAGFTVGAKIDGGPIKPLFYQSAERRVMVPKSARVIDVYIKLNEDAASLWQRLRIDLRAPSMQFWAKSPFPSK